MKKATAVILISIGAFAILLSYFLISANIAKDRRTKEAYEIFIASNDEFYPATYINDRDISALTVEETVDALMEGFNDVDIEIKLYGSLIDSFSLSEIESFKDNLTKKVQAIYDNQTYTLNEYETVPILKVYYITISEIFDITEDEVNKLDFMHLVGCGSSDATLTYSEAKGFTVSKEIYGEEFEASHMVTVINAAVTGGSKQVLLEKDDVIPPAVFAEDEALLEEMNKCNALLEQTVYLAVCNRQETIGADEVKKFLTYDNGVAVNMDAVKEYVSTLKSKYDTYGKDRKFVTSLGTEVVIPGGNYGWSINTDETAKAIADVLLLEDSPHTVEAQYRAWGLRPYNNEIQNTYVEISIDNQHIWMYVDGVLVVDDVCTTGDIATGQYTNRGMFRLTYKTSNCDLHVGDDYFHVSYWMPFDGGIGMHDATWRTEEEFGGDNYLTNGSHGCVNLKLPVAETIYGLIASDTPIIVW